MVEQLVPLAMGFGAAFLGWLVFVVFDKVPTENRQYLDKPPIGFRLIWPLIRLLEYYGGSVILGAYRSELTTRLKKAGAEYRITVEQFFAAKIVSSFIMCVLACSVLILYGSAAALVCLMLAVLAFWYPDLWLKEQAKVRSAAILKELPFYLEEALLKRSETRVKPSFAENLAVCSEILDLGRDAIKLCVISEIEPITLD